jgi:hypothetical protein
MLNAQQKQNLSIFQFFNSHIIILLGVFVCLALKAKQKRGKKFLVPEK